MKLGYVVNNLGLGSGTSRIQKNRLDGDPIGERCDVAGFQPIGLGALAGDCLAAQGGLLCVLAFDENRITTNSRTQLKILRRRMFFPRGCQPSFAETGGVCFGCPSHCLGLRGYCIQVTHCDRTDR